MKGLLKNDKFTFSVICAIAVTIGAFGICAKSLLQDHNGFAVGFACSILLFASLAVIFSASSSEVRARTKDMFFLSIAMVGLYLILFFVVDIAMVYNTGVAICTSVFMAFFMVGCVFALTKLVLELCNIKCAWYEKLLSGELCKELEAKIKASKEKALVEHHAEEDETKAEKDEPTEETAEETEETAEVDDTPVSPLVVEETEQTEDDTIIAEDPAFATPVVDVPVIEPITEKDRRSDDEVAEELSSSLFDEEEGESQPIISEADGTVVNGDEEETFAEEVAESEDGQATDEYTAPETEASDEDGKEEAFAEEEPQTEEETQTEEEPLVEDGEEKAFVDEDDPFGEE